MCKQPIHGNISLVLDIANISESLDCFMWESCWYAWKI